MLCESCGKNYTQGRFCKACLSRWDEISMTPDEQEALSKRYTNDAIIVLPLKSGKLALYSGPQRALCAIIERPEGWDLIETNWTPPPKKIHPPVNLSELGLL